MILPYQFIWNEVKCLFQSRGHMISTFRDVVVEFKLYNYMMSCEKTVIYMMESINYLCAVNFPHS